MNVAYAMAKSDGSSMVKLILFVSIACFVCNLKLQMIRIQRGEKPAGIAVGANKFETFVKTVPNESKRFIRSTQEKESESEKVTPSNRVGELLEPPSQPLAINRNQSAKLTSSRPNVSEAVLEKGNLSKLIAEANDKVQILNEAKFGPVNNSTVVIVVQVHNRAKYLEKLISSLAAAKGIEDALVIFSHDEYKTEINRLIREIKFCKVMQIFFPKSLQVFPDEFPGDDPADCIPGTSPSQARSLKCKNWATPDSFGHYRKASFAQIKHHWWWKANFVFDGIKALQLFDGFVMFLEEDSFASPDFIHVFNIMTSNLTKVCNGCSFISLGNHRTTEAAFDQSTHLFSINQFYSGDYNMGLSFNRSKWEKIKLCADMFCRYDDYNWDWSLLHIAQKCMATDRRTNVLVPKAQRMFHIGDCGIHHYGSLCKHEPTFKTVSNLLQRSSSRLFPAEMDVADRSARGRPPRRNNGGWADPRDHRLCMDHVIKPAPTAFGRILNMLK